MSSYLRGDIASEFLPSKFYAFQLLKNDVFPFWNPFIFSGSDYFSQFQGALFYPFNTVYYFLSLPAGINISFIAHIILLGFLYFLWLKNKNISFLSALTGTFCIMLSSQIVMRVFAGHLSNITVMAWIPLLFLSADKLAVVKNNKWFIVLTCTVCMQILGGHPQYVYYSFIVLIIYAVFISFKEKNKFLIFKIFTAYIISALICSAQLLPGLEFINQSLREYMSFEESAVFSFRPRFFLSYLAANFIPALKQLTADIHISAALWEYSTYFSSALFLVFAFSAFKLIKNTQAAISLLIGIICLIFALGKYTFIYDLMYNFVPLYSSFRGSAKFIFFANLFFIMTACFGLDYLKDNKKEYLKLSAAGIITGFVLIIFSHQITGTVFPSFYGMSDADPAVLAFFKDLSVKNITQYGLILIAAFSMLICGLKHKLFYYIFIICIFAEMLIFAISTKESFTFPNRDMVSFQQLKTAVPQNERIVVDIAIANTGVYYGIENVKGADSNMIKRYWEFLTFSQGKDVNNLSKDLQITDYSPLFGMLRCRKMLVKNLDNTFFVKNFDETDILNRIEILYDYKVLNTRDEIFDYMKNGGFNPRQTVLLELDPDLSGDGKGEYSVKINDVTANGLDFEINTSRPAIVLVTDIYAKGWKAYEFKDSVYEEIPIIQANYILKAVCVDAGNHHIKMKYKPETFNLGLTISLLSSILFAVFVITTFRKKE
ncbi:MAG: hypothetical protein LBR69_02270 [Endomicrobium sp.]|nr:hypothetical protein [Endomicrobium sp.]